MLSLLDTLPPGARAALSANTVLATAVPLQATALPPVPVVPKRAPGGGRPRGSTYIQRDAKRLREQAAKERPPDVPDVPPPRHPRPARAAEQLEPAGEPMALVPWDRASSPHALVPLAEGNKVRSELCLVDQATLKKMHAVKPKIESDLLDTLQAFVSRVVLSDKTGLSTGTVRDKVRLMAFVVIVYKRIMCQLLLWSFDSELRKRAGSGNVTPLYYVTKYKYDEMSIKASGKTGKDGLQAATMKLLQLSVSHLALWKVHGQYIKMLFNVPTSLLQIEKNDAASLTEALGRQVRTPDAAVAMFDDRASIACADDAGANGLADSALSALAATDTESKWKCRTHKVQKVASTIVSRYVNEKRGLLHTIMSFSFAGQFPRFKENMKVYIKPRLKVMPRGQDGAGEIAKAHRDGVFNQFCPKIGKLGDPGDKGAAVTARALAASHVRRRLHNGNFRKTGVFEHWCPGPECCVDADHTFQQLCDLWIDRLDCPRPWRGDDWQGFEHVVDWAGYLLSCHDVLTPVFIMTFPGKPCKGLPAPDAPEAEDGEGDDDLEFQMEVEADMVEPTKESTQFERQSTYRSNARLWLQTKPLARLWSLRKVVGAQMDMHKSIWAQVGTTWEHKELKRRTLGEEPQYRVVMLRRGDHVNAAQEQWARFCVDKAMWVGLPREFHHHDLAVETYRASASAAASTFQLLEVPCQQSGVEEFELLELQQGSAEQLRLSTRLTQRFKRTPCVVDHWWAEHHRRYSSALDIVSSDSMAKIEAHADFVEVDNDSTEAMNANTRKLVKKATQQKVKALVDISAGKVLGEAKAEESEAWMDKFSYTEDDCDSKGQQRGGGGRFRAFVSHHAADHKLPNGRCDFKAICALWRAEMELPEESDLMKQCRERGEVATQAHKMNRGLNGEKVNVTTSAFGKPLVDKLRNENVKLQNQSLIHDFKKCTGKLHIEDTSVAQSEPSQQLAVREAQDTFEQMLVAKHAGQLHMQVLAIHRLARLMASERREAKAKEDELMREKLRAEDTFSTLNLSDVKLQPYDVPLRIARCISRPGTLTVKADMGVLNFAARRVAQVSASRGQLRRTALNLWQKEHNLIKVSDCDSVSAVPKAFKAPYCAEHGHGRCLCSGRGLLINLAKKKFANKIAQLCSPKGSHMRKLLQGSWLVVEIEGVWYHIALCYLRPRRPTFIRMEMDSSRLAWGRQVVAPCLVGKKFLCQSEVDVAESWDLNEAVTCKLFRLVSLDSPVDDFTPAAKLPIEPCDPASFVFWQGSTREMELYRAEVQKEQRKKRALVVAGEHQPHAKRTRTQFQVKAVRRPMDVVEEEIPAIMDMAHPDIDEAAAECDEEVEGEVEEEEEGNPMVDADIDDIDDALFDDPVVEDPDEQLDDLLPDPLPDDILEPPPDDALEPPPGDALEPPPDDVLAQLEDAPAVQARGRYQSALESRDHLQPPHCSLRLYMSKAGNHFWQGRGPKPERKSMSRTISPKLSSDQCIGEIEAWLLLHFS